MKAAPTLDGRIRLDLEDAIDLAVLRAIIADAHGRGDDLAARLAACSEPELAEDWADFVLPDLRASFNSQLETIAAALSEVTPGDTLFIARGDAEAWFGGLNQARLALEARFGLSRDGDVARTGPARSAAIRARFYQMLQGMLLHFLMA
jgi:hypothetical protein